MAVGKARLSEIAERFIDSSTFARTSAVLQFLLDIVSWSVAAIVASYARFVYQGHIDPYGATKDSILRILPVVIFVQAIIGFLIGIYRRRWRYGSFDEVAGLILTSALTTFVLLMLRFFDFSDNPFPRSVIAVSVKSGPASRFHTPNCTMRTGSPAVVVKSRPKSPANQCACNSSSSNCRGTRSSGVSRRRMSSSDAYRWAGSIAALSCTVDPKIHGKSAWMRP